MSLLHDTSSSSFLFMSRGRPYVDRGFDSVVERPDTSLSHPSTSRSPSWFAVFEIHEVPSRTPGVGVHVPVGSPRECSDSTSKLSLIKHGVRERT